MRSGPSFLRFARAKSIRTAPISSRSSSITQAMADACPRAPVTQPFSYISRLSVWNWLPLPPLTPRLPPKIIGSPKSCVAPMVDTMIVNRIVGRIDGMVTLTNCRQRDAPSSAAAS